jgi:transcription-repair coupling factor (superfamily II helicase)
MGAFMRREFDILVSTSIIESGLDVPNANTIIVHNAHHFGVSQLYQLRGRVGRSAVHARAFLVIPQGGNVSAEAKKRLEALEHFTDLGSGYRLAMRDLEIRGAGNLLGVEQHGFIQEIGFETYIRLVKEAVEEIRGASAGDRTNPRVELGIDAYLPEHWIEDGLARISIYQKLARAETVPEIAGIESELRDRFGPLPEAAQMLLLSTEAALLAGTMRLAGIARKQGMFVLTFPEHIADMRILGEYPSKCPYPMRFLASTPLQAVVEVGRGTPAEEAKRCLEVLSKLS